MSSNKDKNKKTSLKEEDLRSVCGGGPGPLQPASKKTKSCVNTSALKNIDSAGIGGGDKE